jgi:predicted O-methyltransferase YrrM
VTDADFAGVLDSIGGVDGWLTPDQARRLWEAASVLPGPARIVEIGSYRGRSTIVLARGAAPGVEVVAIDPHAGNDRGPRQLAGSAAQGAADQEAFAANLRRAGVDGRVRHVRELSQGPAALAAVAGPVDLLFVDGAHGYRAARGDIEAWGGRVADGGTMLVHDAFSSVGVTLAQLRCLAAARRWRYRGRIGSLAEYRREPLTGRQRLANACRQLAVLPWFARNLAIKALIMAGLGRFTRLFGHRQPTWPY